MPEKQISKEKQYGRNPRTIEDKALERLGDHLQRLGDLSGITYCINMKAYVTGNQRSKIMDGAKIVITEKFETPTAQKTVALGYAISPINGEKYAYREVAFDEKEFKEALIVANNDGGEFDFQMIDEDYEEDEITDMGLVMPKMTKDYKFTSDEDDDEIERGTDDDDIPKEKDNTKTTKQPEEERGNVPLFMNVTRIGNVTWEKIKKAWKELPEAEVFEKVMKAYAEANNIK